MMDNIVGDYYVMDNELHNSHEINFRFEKTGFLIYEVMRTSSGIILFLEDHLDRMNNSSSILQLRNSFNQQDLIKGINLLLKSNQNREGNIKVLCSPSQRETNYCAYYIPHYYPTPEMYVQGVKLVSYIIERKNPQAKQIKVNDKIIKEIRRITQEKDVYDILLINKRGYLTECSKSNFFLILGDTLYSAPEEMILKGITRKHLLNIIKEIGLMHVMDPIKISEIKRFDAAFICGTSPKILPIKTIDNINFTVNNPIIHSMTDEYNKLIEDYFNSRRNAINRNLIH